jgi:hypothetical protein
MKQAIMEGGLKTATGRTARDDALARNATTLSTTDATNAAHLEATRLTNEAHLKAAGIHAAGASAASKNQLLQLADAYANAREPGSTRTTADIQQAAKDLHPGGQPRLDPTENMAYGFAQADTGDPNAKPTRAHWEQAAKALHGGAGADARGDAARIAAADKAEARVMGSIPYITEKDPQKQEQMVLTARARAMAGGASAIPDVRDP